MDFGLYSFGSDMGSNEDFDPDACLNPVDRLEKYAESEHMYSRQLAARSLLETFQQLDEYSDAERVLKVLSALANDPDGVVRTELCEQLAQIGNVCMECRTVFTSGGISHDPLANDILPIIFRYMTDPNNQVRKTSQTALADLVEQRLVTNEDIVSKVSPIISKLASMDSSEDHRSEAASLLCRLAPIVGSELTEKLFLAHFVNFCTDHIFQIRKICAVNFGSICQIVGRGKTESLLLVKFFSLCTDAIWGVRKACAECFMQVSLICSPDVRRSHLSAVFINLVADQSRWVRMAAFEALGGFISTFANPSATGLLLTEEGTLVISDPSVVLDEKRINGDLIENVKERIDDLKEELVKTVGNTISITTEEPSVIEMNSLDIGTFANANCVHMIDECGEISPEFSEPCSSGDVSNHLSQETFHADNNVGDLSELAEVCGCGIAPDNQINCNGEHSDELILKSAVALHPHVALHPLVVDEDGTLSAPQQSLENAVGESKSSDDILKNCMGEDVRWDSNGVENQNVAIPGDDIEDVFTDESHSANNHISTATDLDAVDFCQQNELSNGRVNAANDTCALDTCALETCALDTCALDTCALDVCLESSIAYTAADKMTQQFGSLNFWKKMIPELGETIRLESADDVGTHLAENSPFSCSSSEMIPAVAQNLLNSKLLGSVSHLSDSVAATLNGTNTSNHKPFAGEVENGETEARVKIDGGIEQEFSVMQNADPFVENSVSKLKEKLDFDQSVGSEENGSVAPMECDDEDHHTEIIIEPESQSLTLEADEIPVCDESTGNDVHTPLLQQFNDLTCHKSTAMDIGDTADLENGVEVDDEEIHELVAAAKDMPCDDIAIYEQDVVPSDLLEQYLGMMDPLCAQKVDGEITRHCAYSLPAVAYTLGRKNWPSLKNLYTALSADVQWKVRRTLAFSIHELALIVGEEITSRDLVPVFDGFLNDLDEVRIGVLNHLADFLKLLPVEARRGYLLKIAELLKTDNSRNWRFRKELARQLFWLVDLFTVADIQEHIYPIALHLAEDRVSQVRLAAVRVLSHILKQLVGHVEGGDEHCVWTSYLDKLTQQFANSSSCARRQMYIQLCNCILQDSVISDECFATKFLPVLLSLRHDAIPNVRLTLARTIAQHIKHSEFFSSPKNPQHEEVTQAVAALQEDRDQDVRFLININPCEVIEHSSVEIA